MKFLLDTHVIIWVLTDDPHLSDEVRLRIASPANLVYYSIASLWEIAIKNQKNPDKCPYNETEIADYCAEAGYYPMDIQSQHIHALRTLKVKEDRYPANMDPFDRMLLAQAKTEGCRFLTHDKAFENYDEPSVFLF